MIASIKTGTIACLTVASLAAGVVACASSNTPPANAPQEAVIVRQHEMIWPIKTRENVDLWLHGFALLQLDTTAQVPLFQRGYRDDMVVRKNQSNVLTQLDANVQRLRAAFDNNPRLTDAQFAALYFPSVESMRAAITAYVSTNADPSAANTPELRMGFTVLASYFPTPADRAWLSLFASSLWDEQDKYYHSYWIARQRTHGPVVDSVQALWQHLMRPRIQRFLNNTQQANGDILLSPPLGGEGRLLNASGGSKGYILAVPFPDKPADAVQSLYVIAHEVVGGVVGHVVTDNISPAQEREGVGNKLRAVGAVRGGLMLMEQLVPELADGYARYYLQAAGVTPGASPRTQLASVFPLPDAIRKDIAQQVESVQGGI